MLREECCSLAVSRCLVCGDVATGRGVKQGKEAYDFPVLSSFSSLHSPPSSIVAGLLDEPVTAPAFFSYSRVFDAMESIYYRGADGQVSGNSSNSVMGSVGVVNVVDHVPVGQGEDAHTGGWSGEGVGFFSTAMSASFKVQCGIL